MALVWTRAQLLVTFATSRLLLGAGCGPGTAVTQHACFTWYGPREQVLPASLIQVTDHIPQEWIEVVATLADKATIRRRRPPSDMVLWLVVAWRSLEASRLLRSLVD